MVLRHCLRSTKHESPDGAQGIGIELSPVKCKNRGSFGRTVVTMPRPIMNCIIARPCSPEIYDSIYMGDYDGLMTGSYDGLYDGMGGMDTTKPLIGLRRVYDIIEGGT